MSSIDRLKLRVYSELSTVLCLMTLSLFQEIMAMISSVSLGNFISAQGIGARLSSVAMPSQFIRGSNYQSPMLSSGAYFTRSSVSTNVNRTSALTSYYSQISGNVASQYRANSTMSASTSASTPRSTPVSSYCAPCAAAKR